MTVLGVSYARARAVLVAVVALSILVLAFSSLRLTETKQVTTLKEVAAAPAPPTGSVPAIPADVPVPAAVPIAQGDGGVPIDAGSGEPADVDPGPTPTPAPTEEEPEPAPNVPDGVSARIKPCPIDLVEGGPEKNAGGLQSLIPFAPAFGPWAAEAFAAAAIYQPALQLLGPLLTQYPRLQPLVGPYVDQFVSATGLLTTLGFEFLSPLYAPFRTSVLELEGSLAKELAPQVQKLAGSELGGCVIELQNALLEHAGDANAG